MGSGVGRFLADTITDPKLIRRSKFQTILGRVIQDQQAFCSSNEVANESECKPLGFPLLPDSTVSRNVCIESETMANLDLDVAATLLELHKLGDLLENRSLHGGDA